MVSSPEDRLFHEFQRTRRPRTLGRVYDLVADELAHVALRLARDPAEAEDLVQLTFVTAIERADRFQGDRRVLPWLLGILGNHAKRSARRRQQSIELERLTFPPIQDPSRQVEGSELEVELERLLDELPEAFQGVVRLRLRHGLSAPEIAKALDRPQGTVRSQLARGLDIVRRRMPAGLASAGMVAALLPRGHAAVKASIVEAARQALPASSFLLSASFPIASLFAMKKALLAVSAVLLGVLAWTQVPAGEPLSPATPALALAPENDDPVALEAPAAPAPLSVPDTNVEEGRVAAQVEQEPQEPTVATTGRLRIRVVDTAGAALPDEMCIVRSSGGSGRSPEARHKSDGEGLISLNDLEPGHYSAKLFRGDVRGGMVRTGETLELQLVVRDGPLLRGEVRDAYGQPVPGARIWTSSEAHLNTVAVVTRADAAGRFRLQGVLSEQFLGAVADGFAMSASYSPPADGELIIRLDREGTTVAGQVVDDRGQSIAGAEVLLGEMAWAEQGRGTGAGHLPGPPPLKVVTDAEGRFEIVGAWYGEHELQARAPGFGATIEPLTVGAAGVRGARMVLQREAVLRGRVLDESGEPLARVSMRRKPAHRFASVWTQSLDDGSYLLRGLPAGVSDLVLEGRPGRATIEVELAPGEELERDLVLTPSPCVHGTVRDAAGQPLVGWFLSLSNERTRHHAGYETTEAGGQFTFPAEPGQRYRLVVRRPGDVRAMALHSASGLTVGGSPHDIVVPSEAMDAASLRLVILTPEGDPAVGAYLEMWHDEHRSWRKLPVTSPDGELIVTDLPAGALNLNLVHADHPMLRLPVAELEQGRELDLGELRFQASGRLTARITGIEPELLEGLKFSVFAPGGAYGSLERTGQDLRSSPLSEGPFQLSIMGDFVQPVYREVNIRVGEETHVEIELERVGLREVHFLGVPDTVRWIGCQLLDDAGQVVWSGGARRLDSGNFEVRLSARPGRFQLQARSSKGMRVEADVEVLGLDGTQAPLEITVPETF